MSKKSLLINDLFASPEVQLANVHGWNERLRWGFTEEDFNAIGRRPRWPRGPLQALVLTPYLETARATYGALVEIAKYTAGLDPWFPIENWDAKKLRLLRDIEHRPGLRWTAIDFETNRGYSALDVRDAESSPHAEMFAALAHFPEWVRRMDGKEVPYVIVPGYEYSYQFGHGWSNCLAVTSGWEHKDPKGHVLNVRGLSSWDDRHAVAEFVGPNLRRRQQMDKDYSLYDRAARNRKQCDEFIARYMVAEIIKILSAQPDKTASVRTILDEFKARHMRSLDDDKEIVQRDLDAALQSPEFTRSVTVVDGPTGKQVKLRW